MDELQPRHSFIVLIASTSWWAFPARVGMVFAELGWRVEAVCWYGHPMSHTRAIHRIHHYNPMRPAAGLLAAIERAAPDLIVPCDDRAVYHLLELYEALCASGRNDRAEVIARSFGAPDSTPAVRRRDTFIDLARQEGLRAPQTLGIDSPAGLRAALGQIGLPAMLKIDGSWGGLGVARADTAAEAERLFKRMTRPVSLTRALKRLTVNRDPFWILAGLRRTRPRVNVQSFVPGQPATCAIACWKGEVLAMIHADVVRTQYATGAAAIVRIVDRPGMTEAATRIVGRLGLSGFCGLDFMIDSTTGELHLIEMNQRMTPLGHLALGEGRDLVAALAARVSGRPCPARPPVTGQDIVAFFPQAWLFHPDSSYLSTAYHDVPWAETALVRELVRLPWPERSWLARRLPRPPAIADMVAPAKPVITTSASHRRVARSTLLEGPS